MNPLGSMAPFAALLLVSCTLVGCGGDSTSPPPCSPTCPQPIAETLYATTLNQVLALAVDATTGTLTQSAAVDGSNDAPGIAPAPSGDFLYLSDFGNNAVDVFSIAPTTGALAAVSGGPFTAGNPPGGGSLIVDPAGKFLFVIQINDDSVAVFSLDGTTGVPTLVTGSPFPTGTIPSEAAVDPSSKFLYVSNSYDPQGAISAYTIASSGALTPVAGSPFATQASGGPSSLVVHPSGKFLYVGLAGTVNANHVIAGFAINGASGALTPLAGSPFAAGMDPLHIALDPAGKFLYAANIQDNTISAFAINASSGVLTKVAGSPFVTASSLDGVQVDQTGTLLFAASSDEISTFRINASTGALSHIISLQIAGGAQLLTTVQNK